MFTFQPENYWYDNPWSGKLNGAVYYHELPQITRVVDTIIELLDEITICKLTDTDFLYYKGNVHEDSILPVRITRLGIFSINYTKRLGPSITMLETRIQTTRHFEAHARNRTHQELRDMIMELLVTNGSLG